MALILRRRLLLASLALALGTMSHAIWGALMAAFALAYYAVAWPEDFRRARTWGAAALYLLLFGILVGRRV